MNIRDRVKELRRVPAAELRPNPRNWRTHPKAQADALKGLLAEVGFAGAALARELADGTLELIDGHLRAETVTDQPIPVLVLDVTEAEAAKLLATVDPIGSMAGADAAKLDDLLRDVQTSSEAVAALLEQTARNAGCDWAGGGESQTGGGGDEFDTAPEPDGPTRTAPGDLWVIGGKHRLLVGDCTDPANVDRLMGGDKAEMVWTDPPYGVSIGDKNKFLNSIAPSNRVEENLRNDSLDEDGLSRMLSAAFDAAVAVCLPGAAWYVAAPPGPLHLLFAGAMKDRGILRQMLIWVKNNATFSPMGVSYHWRHEPIFYGWMPNGGHRYHGDRKQDTVWEVDRPQASPDHPTMKPVDLVGRAIGHSSQPGDIVYDPFLGSGTTLVAAHRLGRVCYGCEIEPRYADVILRRAEAEGLACEKAG